MRVGGGTRRGPSVGLAQPLADPLRVAGEERAAERRCRPAAPAGGSGGTESAGRLYEE